MENGADVEASLVAGASSEQDGVRQGQGVQPVSVPQGQPERAGVSLHVEFGPVQSFIEEARRTRDSWSGSYILSYLMAHALLAAQEQNATIVYPAVDGDPLITFITNGRAATGESNDLDRIIYRVGSLPDKFEARVTDAGHAKQVAEAAERAWRKEWCRLATCVRDYLWPHGCPPAARVIWDRQIGTADSGGPWSIRWTVGQYHEHNRRWQTYPFNVPAGSQGQADRFESGEMSTIGGGRAALHDMHDDRQAVRRFWSDLSSHLSKRQEPYNIRPDGRERLDAVAAVKRFLPVSKVAAKAFGLPVPEHYPSTRTLAVRPWLSGMLSRRELENAVQAVISSLAAAHVRPARDRSALYPMLMSKQDAKLSNKALLDYDGEVYDPESDEAWEEVKVRHKEDLELENKIKRARARVRQLIAEARRLGIKRPRSHFAVLSMDGDRLSKLLADCPTIKGPLSHALREFSRGVPALIESPDLLGQTVYAGGDDVLAFLPVETALEAADRVREAYVDRLNLLLQEHQADLATWTPTISAAIVYAPVTTPLRVLMRRVHDLLENVAKDEHELGRNACAVEVWKRGGAILQVGRPWTWSDNNESTPKSWVARVAQAVEEIEAETLSSGFIYRLQPLLDMLVPPTALAATATPPLLPHDEEVAILRAEHLKTRNLAQVTSTVEDKERDPISDFTALLRRQSNAAAPRRPNGVLEWPMARFVRFLSEDEE